MMNGVLNLSDKIRNKNNKFCQRRMAIQLLYIGIIFTIIAVALFVPYFAMSKKHSSSTYLNFKII